MHGIGGRTPSIWWIDSRTQCRNTSSTGCYRSPVTEKMAAPMPTSTVGSRGLPKMSINAHVPTVLITSSCATWHNTADEEGSLLTQQTCSNCGARFEDQQFCPDCGQWIDPLDETHFEEFTLGDSPPLDDDEPLTAVQAATPIPQLVNCPSCGAANPTHNRHCEECGARITQGPLPVAPQPMIRTTAGARALAVILGVVAVVAVLAFAWNAIFGGGDEPPPDETTTTSTSQVAASPQQYMPISVNCSSTLEVAADRFACDNLIDGTDRYWNDQSAQGRDAFIEFTFAEPIAIEQIVFKNVVDDDAFKKNYRVKGFEIVTDDLPDRPFIDQLDDDNRSQLILLATLRTRQLTFRVTSTYAAEAVTGETPFNELAIDEFEFYGRPAG